MVKDLIMRTLREQGLETPLQQKRLVEKWPEVAGPMIMRYTLNTYIYNQTLYVRLSNPALRADLSMRREGSQGQNKTYVIALKLAQFDFLKRTASQTTPLLLLDDIFDKLDAGRVEQIVRLVSSDSFGQIFITDTNRDHLDQILSNSHLDYKIFHVEEGKINSKS